MAVGGIGTAGFLIVFVSWMLFQRGKRHYRKYCERFGRNEFFRRIEDDEYVLPPAQHVAGSGRHHVASCFRPCSEGFEDASASAAAVPSVEALWCSSWCSPSGHRSTPRIVPSNTAKWCNKRGLLLVLGSSTRLLRGDLRENLLELAESQREPAQRQPGDKRPDPGQWPRAEQQAATETAAVQGIFAVVEPQTAATRMKAAGHVVEAGPTYDGGHG
eukprot:CAMPEP_0177534290 /NCGR_PEP_ID=MMETSP0369-20130122/55849_1 /TAXON_ID=447022 ORGANISM="Scrippsiella hangoei-like, Strain SHHI-4" /NCGR_SAMPLE_ID=MMETSP0369 /ASSEMBLY_ACC=CAM_ASM_000364 /LENGTH=215 /DNA_ID=CAMNT_0019016193 /DNA_START=18 /DNA_END=662 /DNA_ORIENTATION=-